MSEEQVCSSGAYAQEACAALANLNRTWRASFAQSRVPFEAPGLDLFRDGRVTTDGCGSATSAAGPFYCPADRHIYIDTMGLNPAVIRAAVDLLGAEAFVREGAKVLRDLAAGAPSR